MKHLKTSILAIALFSIFSISAFADSLTVHNTKTLSTVIENYVSTLDQSIEDGSAQIFTHFLVKEEGFIYSVDFMLTNSGEIIVLSKEDEKEYYRVDGFNAEHMGTYSIPVTNIKA